MKHGTKLQERPSAASSATSSGISAHRLSRAIAKAPPRKIRIVHILAPEIIKTEARHFRELVQRLTGKPAPNNGADAAASPEYTSTSSPPGSCDTAGDEGLGASSAAAVIKGEVKEEPETSSGGGYLRALGLDDGSNDLFFQGLEDILFDSCNNDGFSF